MRNNDVLDLFMQGNKARNSGKNLESTGDMLINYSTPIAKHFGGITLINGTNYSSTTSKHQNYLVKNSFCVVVHKSEFDFLTDLDYELAYDIVYALYQLKDETCVNLTSTLRRDERLVYEAMKIMYTNKK